MSAADATIPTLSAIILTYNRAPLLPRALDSILSQLTPNAELLVIDDGSTDGTPDLLQTYRARIRVHRQDHVGNMAGCRAAFHNARADWFLFVDSDDELRPGALSVLLQAAADHPDASLILTRNVSIDPSGRAIESSHPALHADALVNLASFAQGRLRAVIAGGLIHRSLLALFDDAKFHPVHGVDQAVFAAGLARKTILLDAATLNIYAHPGRLRTNVQSIHASGTQLVDMIFTGPILPPSAQHLRPAFTAFLNLERARAYHRARWHSQAWRAYAAAFSDSPRALLSFRHLRRTAVSLLKDLTCTPEGPVKTPPAPFFIGHGPQLWKNSIRLLLQWSREYAPVFRLRIRPRTYVLCDPDDGTHVLVTNPKPYHKTGILKIDPVLAGGFIGLDHPRHAEQRRNTPVNFGKQSTQTFLISAADVMIRQTSIWSQSSPAPVGILSQALFVQLAGMLILGCDDAERLRELTTLLGVAHQCSRREMRARYRFPGIPAPRWLPLKRRRRAKAAQRNIHAWFDRFLADHPASTGTSMLSSIRRALPPAQADDPAQVRSLALMTYLGAMEPTSITLAWALELLANHPAAQDRIHAEVLNIVGAASPTFEHLSNLTFTANIVSETARLYPNEWLLTRRATQEDRLPSGLRIRAGEEVMISPYLYGHAARFFPNPETFDPDRFSRPPTWPANAYIPFGAGPRSCIGEPIARRLLALALAILIRQYRFSPSPTDRGTLESPNLFTSQPINSHVPLLISPRA